MTARDASAPDVSVVIVSWNTRDALRACLASVRDGTSVPHEVFVVDNASADGSAAMVRAEFPAVRLIANDENRGFAAANNQALRRARGRHVLLLNPDTTVVGDAIGAAVRIADADPSIGALGCQVMLSADEIQRTCFRDSTVPRLLWTACRLDRLVPARLAGGPTMRDWDRRSARDVDVVSGMFLLVPRAVLDEVGPMDEAFFVYAEEADWCRRIRAKGRRCVFTPEARIVHHDGGGKSTAQAKVRMHVQLQKSVLILHRKHGGALSWAGAKAVLAGAALVRGAAFAFRSLLRPGDAAARDGLRCAAASLRFHLLGAEPASPPQQRARPIGVPAGSPRPVAAETAS